jgi:hypothetical protein
MDLVQFVLQCTIEQRRGGGGGDEEDEVVVVVYLARLPLFLFPVPVD